MKVLEKNLGAAKMIYAIQTVTIDCRVKNEKEKRSKGWQSFPSSSPAEKPR